MNQPAVAHESSAVIHADEMTLILAALTQLKRGDAKVRLPYHGAGAYGKVAEVFNDLVEQSAMIGAQVRRRYAGHPRERSRCNGRSWRCSRASAGRKS